MCFRARRAVNPAASKVRTAEWGKAVLGLIAAFMILTAPPRAYCQDTLCLHFDSQSSGIRLRLERGYLINGVLPMTVCDLRSGESWKLVTDGRGLETKIGRLYLDAGGRPTISGSRMGMMMKNAFIPGAGSMKNGRVASGLMDLGLVVTSGYYWMTEQFQYSDMDEAYNRLVRRCSEASSYEAISRL